MKHKFAFPGQHKEAPLIVKRILIVFAALATHIEFGPFRSKTQFGLTRNVFNLSYHFFFLGCSWLEQGIQEVHWEAHLIEQELESPDIVRISEQFEFLHNSFN